MDETSIVVANVPEELRTKLGCNDKLRISCDESISSGNPDTVQIDSPIMAQLVDELKSQQTIGRAVPEVQPNSVRDVSQRLFDQYTIDGGSVHLAGCTLEDRAVLRVSYLNASSSNASKPLLAHRFVSLTGEVVDDLLVEQLRLGRLTVPTQSPRVTDDQAQRWDEVGKAFVAEVEGSLPTGFVLTTAIWCKYAEGKLSFVIGDATKSLSFSGWAQRYVEGIEKPPALTCPAFEQGSHHLAATDDGNIVPIEAIATCSESGKRVLATDLETCVATNAQALPESFVTCPASGERVLRRALQRCSTCTQSVSPTSLQDHQCGACRSLEQVRKDDPRMARLLGEYPKLDRWSRWKLAETTAAYVLVASSLLKRLLLVIDKNDLGVLRLAKGSQFSKKWAEASDVDRSAYLG